MSAWTDFSVVGAHANSKHFCGDDNKMEVSVNLATQEVRLGWVQGEGFFTSKGHLSSILFCSYCGEKVPVKAICNKAVIEFQKMVDKLPDDTK